MKVAAYIATLLVRLVGIYLLFKSFVGVFRLNATLVSSPLGDQLAIVVVLQTAGGVLATLLAGRIVRLFTADAPFGNE
jgi:hypothetical protein